MDKEGFRISTQQVGRVYAPLHVHTDHSLMDGVAKSDEYARRAVEVGMTSLAITDHGTLSGHRPHYRACKEVGIKPILGVEGYFADDRTDKEAKTTHIVILAKNDLGLENLGKLNEAAWNTGFYKKPRMDYELLDKFGDGLIVSSACMGGPINQAVENEDFAKAKAYLKWFGDRFGDDFYVELMPHNTEGMNHALIDLADAGGYKIIVTPDCHHATVDQKVIQEVMLILNTHAKLEKDVTYAESTKRANLMDRLDYLYGRDRKMSFNQFDIHLLSGDEMYQSMMDNMYSPREQTTGGMTVRDDMFTNTLDIEAQIEEYTVPRNLNLLPVEHRDPDKEIRTEVFAFLKRTGLDQNPIYVARAEEELKAIAEKKFASYFIVVRNMIQYARNQGIMVGPGRGSSAGSLVCFALEITMVDPIKYGLLFFRFIDISRNDFPDIDTDIQDNRREEVKEYLEKQYRYVASIATFNKFGGAKDGAAGGKGMIKDISRTLNIPLNEVNRAIKKIASWDQYLVSDDTEWFRDKYPMVEEIGNQMVGRIRGTGIHAAGIVTSKTPISKVAPMETRSVVGQDIRIPVVAVDMEEAADIGLIKIDALGLKTLTVIDDALKIIKKRAGKTIDLYNLPLDEKRVYDMLSSGHTKGVFQCEAAPYTHLLVKMGVSNFDQLVASNALVRPGAMNTIGKDYVARKRGTQGTVYSHNIMKEFTSDTYGCILYQEQVMLACTTLGGMSMEEANKVRKIIGKKKDVKEFDQFKNAFIKNATKPLGGAAAEKMWHDFEAHAGYSFNKSHAVAYSMISYWTAWLKTHYPLEFMFALLKNEKDKDARTGYLIETRRMGIPVMLPHVNDSDSEFKIEGNGIRFGMVAIKYISDKIADRYIAARPFGSYKELEEFTFTKGSGVNSRALASMKIIGAATFPDNPRNPEEIKENLYEYLGLPDFKNSVPEHYHAFLSSTEDFEEKGAYILLGNVRDIKRGTGWARVEILDNTGQIGVFDNEDTSVESGRTYVFLVGSNRIVEAVPVDEIAESDSPLIKYLNYRQVTFSDDQYLVMSFKPRITKAGNRMASLIVADSARELISIVVFPREFATAYTHLEVGKAYTITCNQTKDGDLAFKGVVT